MGSLAMASESLSRENLTTFQDFNQYYPETEFSDQYLEYPQTDLFKNNDSWPKNKISKKKTQVFLEGTYVESSSSTGTADDDEQIGRTKSLTDEDLEELKGCLDLGFGFSYEEIPELCNTLPALELCYSMSQKFLDEQQQHKSLDSADSTVTLPESASPPSGPIANWKISSPGDHPEDVKARLKFWAQAVACTVRLCS